MTENDQALVRQDDTTALMPTPVFTGQQMGKALAAYKELQQALDESMPDQLMTIGTGKNQKVFRKKGYWRAVRVAFNLEVELVSEERIVAGEFADHRENFAYNVTYRATAHGVSVTGDGSASAVEKARKFRCPHPHPTKHDYTLHWRPEDCPAWSPDYIWRILPLEATEHNIRSHAHTRAFNRAVSNLCGFGEVSADEIRDPEQLEEPEVTSAPPPQGPQRPLSNRPPAPPREEDELPPVEEPSGHYEDPYTAHGPRQPQQRAVPNPQPGHRGGPAGRAGRTISKAQDTRYFALAMKAGWSKEDLKAALKEVWGYERSDHIPMDQDNDIVKWVEAGPPR